MSKAEAYQILQFVRRAIGAELECCAEPEIPELPCLREKAGSFVALIGFDGETRGCIGSLTPFEPLGENLRRNALNAAFGDPSFPPLEPEELEETRIRVYLPGVPRLIANEEEYVPGRDGILLEAGEHRALFLPDIPLEQRWSRDETLGYLARKAGIADWREGQLSVFDTEIIAE